MPNWIIISPVWDEITKYSYNWAQEIAFHLKERGLLVADLGGRPVSRAEVEQAINEHPDAYVGFWDHGDEDCLWGSQAEKVLDLKNCDLLANKEVYTLACLSAQQLGAAVWQKDGTYYGYVDAFSFTTDALPSFQQAANCGFKFRFFEGDTCENTLERAKGTLDQLAIELVYAGKTLAAISMRSNRNALVYYNGEKPAGEKGCPVAKWLRKLRNR